LVYPLLSNFVAASILAYRDYENHRDGQKASEIKERIGDLEAWRTGFKSIENPQNTRGTPMHIMQWQIERLKPKLAQRLSEFT
jgi:hypothetical protein